MKVLRNFNMDKSKSVSTLLRAHFRLTSTTKKEIKEQHDYMKSVPYKSIV